MFGTIAFTHTKLGQVPAPTYYAGKRWSCRSFFSPCGDSRWQAEKYARDGGKFARTGDGSAGGFHFQSEVFTNRDSATLAFHKNFEAYFAAKRRLFEGTGAGRTDTAMSTLEIRTANALGGSRTDVDYMAWRKRPDVLLKKVRFHRMDFSYRAQSARKTADLGRRSSGPLNVYNILAAWRVTGMPACEMKHRGRNPRTRKCLRELQLVEWGSHFWRLWICD